MKNKFIYTLITSIFFLISTYAQVGKPFTQRLSSGNLKIKGDVILLGNSVVTSKLPANSPYNGFEDNDLNDGTYIDIDSDASTFNSSSSSLNITQSCKRIVFAGLYWASFYPNEVGTDFTSETTGTARLSDWNQVKFKTPGGSYIDLSADNNTDIAGEEDSIIFDGFNASNPASSFKNSPIICYKNVTSILQALTDANGEYTVANLRATTGKRLNGCAGGWTLVIIYESPSLPNKYITLFDGYAGLNSATLPNLDLNVSGYKTLQAPLPVRAQIGMAALDGDYSNASDKVEFKSSTLSSFTEITDAQNPTNNFFNSTISKQGNIVSTRNPNGSNTLGFDLDYVDIPNGGNSIIPNNDTSGTIRVSSSGDSFGTFLTTFSAESVEPEIVLTKVVQDNLGNQITGNVILSQQLNYVLTFQNIGSDNATGYTIKDILPSNVIFNYPTDLVLPAGVTSTYDSASRTLVLTIPDSMVEINDPKYEIKIKVKVVPTCNELIVACSNKITNQAFSTYKGVLNTNQVSDDPSIAFNNGCNLGVAEATNFIVGIDNCEFNNTAILCGTSMEIKAASGYTSYSWSNSITGTPVLGTSRELTVTSPGIYYVVDTIAAPCNSIKQKFTVTPFGSTVINPVISFADEVVVCPNDGKKLPNIYLCGANASRLIQTNISDAVSLSWEKLNTASCGVGSIYCANESNSCIWNPLGTTSNFNVTTEGQYRLKINYSGGCFSIFHFNVYQNQLSPSAVVTDIICNSPGKITINNVPSGYEFSYTTAATPTTWVASNVFTTTTVGVYNVFIRQTGVGANACVFSVLGLPIVNKNFNTTIISSPPLCSGGLGSIKVAANNVQPQYNFSLFQGSTLINSVGPIATSDYTFSNLNPGTYIVNTTTTDGCTDSKTVVVSSTTGLAVTTAITKPLTCTDGEVTIYPSGGTPPYFYFINGSATFQTSPTLVVTNSGTISIKVTDNNNCVGTATVNVVKNAPPVFIVSQKNINCSGASTGEITFNVSNSNGYTLEYSIDNGVTYTTSNVFSNLIAGSYITSLKYSLGTSVCYSATQSVVITQPAYPLKATGGVSAVACTSNGGNGKIRITNPEGGVAPYQYNFGSGYQSSNEASVPPGTYTISIRDANLCVFLLTVTVDALAPDPTISVQDPAYSCDGKATSNVVVNNGSSNYAYTYLLDGVPNSPPSNNTFYNVPCGNHTIKVKYELQTAPTYSTLLEETFGSGENTTTPGISPLYCYEPQTGTGATCGPFLNMLTLNDGEYVVTKAIIPNQAGWFPYRDHTSIPPLPAPQTPTDPNGRFLAVNIGASAGPNGVLYSKQIIDVIPNQPIKAEVYFANLLFAWNNQANPVSDDPSFILELVDSSGAVVASDTSGPVQNFLNEWQLRSFTLNPGNNTVLTFKIRSGSIQYGGNDAGIDDIRIWQIPVSCKTEKDYTINIGCNKAFSSQIISSKNVTCFGNTDGQITFGVQNFNLTNGFLYSINNGTTWLNSLISPVVVTGLGVGTYPIKVKYDATDPSVNLLQNGDFNTTSNWNIVQTGSTINGNGSISPGFLNLSGDFNTPNNGYLVTQNYTPCLSSTSKISLVLRSVNGGVFNATLKIKLGSIVFAELKTSSSGTGTITYLNNATGNLTTFTDGTFINLNINIPNISAPGPFAFDFSVEYGGGADDFQIDSVSLLCNPTCVIDLSQQITGPSAALALTASITKQPTCLTGATTTASATGGTTPYQYQLSNATNAAILVPFQNNPVFANLAAGNYLVTVKDLNSCSKPLATSITILPVSSPIASISTASDLCYDGTNAATIVVTATGGLLPYQYNINGGTYQSSNTFSNLLPGSYTISVRDSNNCVITLPSQTIANQLLATFSLSKDLDCSVSPNALIVSTITGGIAPFTYQVSYNGGVLSSSVTLASNTLSYTATNSGAYVFTIKDSVGCTVTATQTINPKLFPTVTTSVTNIVCASSTGTIVLNASSGKPPYTYSINNGVTFAANNTFTGLAAGVYTYVVKDSNNCSTTASVTITEAGNYLSATAGVSSLACGSSGGNGTVRITNPQNGLPPYQYDFGSGYQSLNEATKPPGTHIVKIKDAKLCEYSMTVTVDPVFPSPTLSLNPIVYNCNGTANVQVTMTGNTTSYDYTYLLDNVVASPTSNLTFNNLNCGLHTISVISKLNIVPTFSYLLNETFGTGSKTTASGIASAYCFEDQVSGVCGPSQLIDDNEYSVTNIISPIYPQWFDYRDHTSNGTDPNGRFLAINIGSAAGANGVLYSKQINDILPNQPLKVEVYFANLLKVGIFLSNPSFILELVDSSNNVIASQNSGTIFNTINAWQLKTFTLNPGNNTNLTFKIRSGSTDYGGNDCAIDDITIYQVPQSCTIQTNLPFVVECNKTFAAQVSAFKNVNCLGVNDGQFTISVQNFNTTTGFDYSINNGATWATSLTSPVVVSGLGAATYQIKVRYDATNSCVVSLTQQITAPSAILALTTSISKQPTCLTGATITATATGGTAPYQYQLSNATTSAIITSFQNSSSFPNLSIGSYIVTVKDAKGCTVPTSSSITIVAPSVPTASISSASDLCYDGANQATIVVTATGGLAPYQYSINASTYQSSNTFSNLIPGNYIISVKDANNCIVTLPSQTIANQLQATLTLSKDLDCSVSPNALIVSTITGGIAPFTYQVSYNGGALSSSISLASNTLSYAATNSGTYAFTIKDSVGCTVIATQTISPKLFPIVSTSVTNIVCASTTGVVVLTASSGKPPYTYSINNGTTFVSNNTFTGLLAGTYNYVVKDSNNCTTAGSVTVTEAGNYLSATAGVSSLACGNGNGTIRITNPQNGVPPYQYDFGSGYQSLNEATKAPGTYTVKIKDAKSCEYLMTVTIDPAVPSPTITLNPLIYNCNGTANVQVTMTGNTTLYDYSYLLDNVAATPTSNITFNNLSCGSHTITVNAKLNITPSFSYLLKETFGSGNNTTAPGIAPGYCFEAQIPGPTACGGSPDIGYNDYSVTHKITYNNPSWFPYIDHTDPVNDPSGRFLAVNLGTATGLDGILYSKVINSIIPNQPLKVEVYFANLILAGIAAPPPSFTIQLVDGSGNVVAVDNSGNILNTANAWQLKTFTLNPGNNTSLTFRIISASVVFGGNDAGIDDITIYQIPQTCIIQTNLPFVVECNKTFAAQISASKNISCLGVNDGQFTISVQNFNTTTGFQYSINNGATWTTSLTSPVVVSGLGASTYQIKVRYDATNSCVVSLTQQITAPSAILALTASISKQPTCLTGATITATATGGTAPYQYQLTNATTSAIITAYQNNNLFSNLPSGSYLVTVKDTNGCTAPIASSITIVPPTLPTASISSSSDLCYDKTNASTLVVTATGGLAPYQYNINGGVYQSNNTFSNLTPGSYVVSVKDVNDCITTLPSQTIANQLVADIALSKDIDCSASPNAVIVGTITGGVAPYTCQLSYNSGANTAISLSGNNLVYTASNSGNYVFTITDSIGCTYQSTKTIAPLVNPAITVVTQTQQILCNGDATGAINITLDTTKGVAPYTFNVLNTTTSVNYGSQTTGLPAGIYSVSVIDAKSCSDTRTITLSEPTAVSYTYVVQNIECTGTGISLGSIQVSTQTGGVAPYTYYLTNNNGDVFAPFTATTGQSHIFNNLNFGIFELSVVDANGCSKKIQNIRIASPPNNLDITLTTSPTSCASACINVKVTALVIGNGPYFFAKYPINSASVPPYDFASNSTLYQPETSIGSRDTNFCGLLPGVKYSFIVYDSFTNCYYFKEADAPIPVFTQLQNTITKVSNVTCKGSSDGKVSFQLTNYAPATTINYTIYKAQYNTPVTPAISVTLTGLTGSVTTVSDVGNLAPGTYYILFSEGNGTFAGCTSTSANFTITESATLLQVTANATKNDNCNLNVGQVQVIASDGTAPYTYQVLPASVPAPVATSTGWVTLNTFNLESGSYIAYVNDAFNCIKSVPVSVTLDPTPVISASATNQCTASNGNFTITVNLDTNGIAPYSYSLDGGTYQVQTASNFTYTNLTSGNHTIQVKDFNGCGNTVNVNIQTPINFNPIFTQLPTCATNDGVVTVSPTGGSGNYSYAIVPSAGIVLTNNVFSAIPAGSYVITMTDTQTGCSVSSTINLSFPTPVTFTTTVTDVSCNAGNDGTITVNLPATNDNGPYTYQLNGGTAQSSNIFTGLVAGTYTIRVNSSRGCSATDTTVIVGEPAILTATASATAFTCANDNTVNTSTITVTGTGGTLPYTTSIDGTNYITGNTFAINNTGSVQNFTIYVKDAKGCIATTPLVVSPLSSVTAVTVTRTTAITCNNDEVVAISATGGSGNFSYQLLPSGTPQASNVFNLATPGTYYFSVKDTTTGCSTTTLAYTVAEYKLLNVLASQQSAVSCFGQSNGVTAVTITGYAGAYTYTVTDSTTGTTVSTGTGNTTTSPLIISGLAFGSYLITVTETSSPFCSATSNIVGMGQPSAPLTMAIVSNNNANCNSQAIVTVSATGGTPAYTYAFVTQGTTPIASNYVATPTATLNPLTSANWDIYVKDANGCTTSTTVIVLTDPTPVVTLPNVAPDQCTSSGNLYTLVASGTGVAPFEYSLNGGVFQTNNVFEVYASGTYTITIKDANGCTSSTNTTVCAPLNFNPIFTQLPTCATNDGIVTVSPTGGSGNYSYAIVPSAGIVLTNNVFSAIPAGSYVLTMTDTQTGCSVSSTINLSFPTPVTFTTTVTDVSCNAGNDGTITVNLPATNDNGPYTYQLNGGTAQSSNIFTGLVAGTYTIRVNSSRGCSATDTTVVVGEPAILTATASATAFTCANDNTVNTSTITVTGTGGTLPYTTSIDGTNYITGNTFAINNTGSVQNFTIYVKDAKGCIATTPLVVSPLSSVTAVTVTRTTAITCNNDEVVAISATGGSGNFSYQLLPSGTPQASNVFNLATPGTYYFSVKDTTTGCSTTTLAYTVAEYKLLNVLASQQSAVSCFGQSNGVTAVTITGYAGAYTYTVTDSTTGTTVSTGTGNTTTSPLIISGLAFGSYLITVTETSSPFCSATSNIVGMGQPSAPLTMAIVSNKNANCNSQAIVTVSATGGTPAYTYAFVTQGTTPIASNYVATPTATLNPLTSANWDIYVKDANGCTTSTTVIVLTDPTPVVTLPNVAPDQCTSSGNLYTLVASGTGVAPFEYSLNGGVFQTNNVFEVYASGTYTITIKDANGCTSSTNTTVYAPLNFNPIFTQLPTCATNDGVVTVSATGGSGNYSYAIVPSAGIVLTNNVFSAIPAGSYVLTMTDTQTGCSVSSTINLSFPTPVTFTTTITDVSCNAGNDGTITVNLPATNDNGPYTYQLNGGTAQSSNIFTGLVAGTYTIRVNSSRGCSATDTTVVVGEPAQIVISSITTNQFTCSNNSNTPNYATITVNTVTGGTNVFTTYEFVKNGVVVQSGSSNQFIDSTMLGGNFVINVSDTNGCIGTNSASITLNPYSYFSTPVITVTTPITCVNNETIKVAVTITGSIPTINYTIVGINGTVYSASNTTGIFSNLAIGDYEITVTNPLTGCSEKVIHFVTDANTFDIAVATISNATCYGDASGSVSITMIDTQTTPTNDAGGFSYTITGPSPKSGTSANVGPVTISNLLPGLYTITATLTNLPRCITASKTFMVLQPNEPLTLIVSETASVTCLNGKGIITAVASGGWDTNYQYALAGPSNVAFSSTNVFNNLSAGTYTVSVKDSVGCTVSSSITISIPAPISATLGTSTPLLSCYGDATGVITVGTVTGGQGSGYLYTLNNNSNVPNTKSGPVPNNTFTGLTAGSYTVTVTDSYNCSFTTLPIIISQPAQVIANLSIQTTQTCLNQTQLSLSATGGTPPYSYSTDGINYNATTFASSVTISVPTGVYNYFIKDSKGCTSFVSNDVNIVPLTPLTVNLQLGNSAINCFGDNSGSIIANTAGGLGNYQYILTNVTTGAVSASQTSNVFNGLFAGTYQVQVVSGDCTATSAQITLTQPSTALSFTPIKQDVTCNGAADGKITINATGGTGVITYAISPNLNQFFLTNTFTNLNVGTYDMIIQDANGCFLPHQFTITEPTNITASVVTITQQEVCAGDLNGAFIFDVQGGTQPYSYSIDNANGTYITGSATQSQFNVTGISGGVHTVYIKDKNGCNPSNLTVTLDASAVINPIASPNIFCATDTVLNNVVVTVDTSATNDVQYSLDGGAYQASNVFENLTVGNHFVNVKHTNGCIKQTPVFAITAVTPIQLFVSTGELNQIVVTATGGVPDYTYSLNGVDYGSTNKFIIWQTGKYTITVTDSKGCTATYLDFYMEFIDIFIPNVFTPNGDGNNDGWAPQNTQNYKNLVFYIFDRYGRKIATRFEGQTWDGKYNDAELPSGDYWYVVKIDGENGSREFVGNFTLYR